MKLEVDPFYLHCPAGATIVTSHARGGDNAVAVAWHSAVSREPSYCAVSISPKRFSHGLLMESGEFAVNFMPYAKGELLAHVAGCSGRNLDKFPMFKISASLGTRVKAPVLTDAFEAYECRIVGRHRYGDHDLIAGEVLAAQWEASAFTSDGGLDLEHVSPIV